MPLSQSNHLLETAAFNTERDHFDPTAFLSGQAAN